MRNRILFLLLPLLLLTGNLSANSINQILTETRNALQKMGTP